MSSATRSTVIGQPPAGRKSVIDEGTTFRGVVASSSTVQVLGVLEGEVTGPALEVDRGGVIIGKAKVAELRSHGELAGEFDADDVELWGKVRDQTVIRARSLLVGPADGHPADGEPVFGECQIDVGDLPSKEQAVAQARANGRPEQSQPIALSATAPAPLPPPAASPPSAPAPVELVADAPTTADRPPETDNTQVTGGGPKKKKLPSERPVDGA